MAAPTSLLVFVVNLLVGTFGIYAGARLVSGVDDPGRALVTALLGAIAWGIASAVVGWIPVLGPLLALVVWVAVIDWRYPGGFVNAALIGFVAWVAVILVLSVVGQIWGSGDAVGVPGS